MSRQVSTQLQAEAVTATIKKLCYAADSYKTGDGLIVIKDSASHRHDAAAISGIC